MFWYTMQSVLTTAQPARHPSPTVKATSLAYIAFERPDIERADAFLTDFGLVLAERTATTRFYRGVGSPPFCYVVTKADRAAFAGFGFTVAHREDLEKLAAVPGASRIEPLDAPGGGERVRLREPSGFTVDAVHGQKLAHPLPHRSALPHNNADVRVRVNATQRPPIEPAQVLRIGHLVLEVADYQATSAWLTQHFGFIPSDVLVLPDGSPALTFFRLDLGNAPTDHHTLALVQGFKPVYSHSAYEVIDADAVGVGSRVLTQRGWKHAWGIGRHILGSQIFDYWNDPWDDKHEHYCDGDLFTADAPMGIHPLAREGMAQWGPEMPASFTRPKPTLANVRALVRNVRRSPDLSLGKLLTILKLVG